MSQDSPQLWLEWEWRQLSLREAVEEPELEAQGCSIYPRVNTSAQKVQLVAGGLGEVWEALLSELAGGLPRQMPRSGPGAGPKGLRASAKPLLAHKGLLTCARSVGPCWGLACVCGDSHLQAPGPLRAQTALPPWRQLASRDGGGLGHVCVLGAALSSRALCPRARQGHSRPLHTWVSTAPLGDASNYGDALRGWSLARVTGDPESSRKGGVGEDRRVEMEAARLRTAGPQAVVVVGSSEGA